MKRRLAAAAMALASLAMATACGQTTSYAVSVDGVARAPSVGPVTIYATREPPGVELGIVEARGYGDDGTVERLIPELVRRAQALGADAVVVDVIGLAVELVPTPALEGPPLCTPVGCSTPVPRVTEQEVVSVRVRGRAFRSGATP